MIENNKYEKALSRTDLSQWLTHFCKDDNEINNTNISAYDSLKSILSKGKIFASKQSSITRHERKGATCFYDAPPQNYNQILETNPNKRRGYGLIVSKPAFWYLGGRPVIYYYDDYNEREWPRNERFRLVYTDLNRIPPIDWTHEREWRICGDFDFNNNDIDETWWWPCVESIRDAQSIFREFRDIHSIYVLELGKTLNKNEIYI
jgi:hypothetical protein